MFSISKHDTILNTYVRILDTSSSKDRLSRNCLLCNRPSHLVERSMDVDSKLLCTPLYLDNKLSCYESESGLFS